MGKICHVAWLLFVAHFDQHHEIFQFTVTLFREPATKTDGSATDADAATDAAADADAANATDATDAADATNAANATMAENAAAATNTVYGWTSQGARCPRGSVPGYSQPPFVCSAKIDEATGISNDGT